jgi:hypothetical protein
MMGTIREHQKELSSARIRSPLPLNRGRTAQCAASLRDAAASCFVCVLQLRSGLRRGHGNDLPEGSKPVGASRGPDNRIFRSGLGKLTIEICKEHHGLWADAVVF